MHTPKSPRHQSAARARWRAAEAHAEAERADGIPDRAGWQDAREPIDLDLCSVGGRAWRLEPRLGYLAWRQIDSATGEVVRCAALKTLLREIADKLPRQMSASGAYGAMP